EGFAALLSDLKERSGLSYGVLAKRLHVGTSTLHRYVQGETVPLVRPINHVLLTVTNTGTAACSVYYYPDLRFDADQQAVTQAVEDSKPQAVVTIDPGQSAYASIGTSAADSSAGKVEPQVEVFLESLDQSGSLPGSLKLPLPNGTVVDQNSAFVTYWQYDMQSAIAW
uniref:DUF4232 domain-containing protein n=1 Tax=Catenulispora rubra TaxID=280293 RepID=UPI0018920CC1